MKYVLISAQTSQFDIDLARKFAAEGYGVYTLGESPVDGVTSLSADLARAVEQLGDAAIDYLADVTDNRDAEDSFTFRDGIRADVIQRVYRANTLRSMAILEAFLPALDRAQTKRLFYLTSSDASVNESRAISGFGYNMSRAAMSQFIQMIRNKLTPLGYTYRIFDPMHGAYSPEVTASSAFSYITRRRGTENFDPRRDDEDNLVYRDAEGRQHAW